MKLNADPRQRAVVHSETLVWLASPLPGVERRMLERDGEEVARATSVVRYAPGSHFDAHTHALGEEFLVLDGVFSDDTGDFPAGMYVRNPPGSSHAPHSAGGCTILVKLRQFDPADAAYVRIDTNAGAWIAAPDGGPSVMALFHREAEDVALLRWTPGARGPRVAHPGGEEIFVLEGGLEDEHGTYPAGTWVRNPPGSSTCWSSPRGCRAYVKRGHLGNA